MGKSREEILAQLNIDNEEIKNMSDRNIDDKDLILEIFSNSNLSWFKKLDVFKCMSDNLKDDKDFILKLVKIDSRVFEYISNRLKNDIDVVLETFDSTLKLYNLDSDDKYDIEDFCYSIYEILTETSSEFINDEKFVESIIKKMGLQTFGKSVKTFAECGVSTSVIHNALKKIENELDSNSFNKDYDNIMKVDSTEYSSLEDIISVNIPDYNKYILDVVKISVDAIGIEKFVKGGTFREQMGLDTYDYNMVVRSMYKLIEELLKRGDFKFELYNYGSRSPEYEKFRRDLSDLTGIAVECFTSDLERRIREKQYFSTSNFTPEVAELMTEKPVLFIGNEKSYYQADMSDQSSYIKEVFNKHREL